MACTELGQLPCSEPITGFSRREVAQMDVEMEYGLQIWLTEETGEIETAIENISTRQVTRRRGSEPFWRRKTVPQSPQTYAPRSSKKNSLKHAYSFKYISGCNCQTNS